MAEDEFSTVIPSQNRDFGHYPWTRRPLWESGSQWRSSSTPLEQKNLRIEALTRVRPIFLPCLHHSFPKAAQQGGTLLSLQFNPQEHVNKHLASPAVQDSWGNVGPEAHFLTSPRLLRWSTRLMGSEGLWEHSNQGSELIKGTLLTALQTPKSLPTSHWRLLACRNPNGSWASLILRTSDP